MEQESMASSEDLSGRSAPSSSSPGVRSSVVKVTSYEERSTQQMPQNGPCSFSSQIEIKGIRPRSFSPSLRNMMADPFFSSGRRIPRMFPSAFAENMMEEMTGSVPQDFIENQPKYSKSRFRDIDSTSGYASGSSSSSLPDYQSHRRDCPNDDNKSVSSDRIATSPPPDSATGGSQSESQSKQKKESREHLRQSLVKVLDELDARVTFLRETATELEEEKDKLLSTLKALESHNKLELVDEIDREEMIATSNRLLLMLDTVAICVQTRRNQEQEAAFKSVTCILDSLEKRFNSSLIPDREDAQRRCQIFLTTCLSTSDSRAVIDEKFQKQIIACTVDDQKRIRKRLQQLMRDYLRQGRPTSPSSNG